MSVGAELREARNLAGLTVEDVAERTEVQLYKIDALESDSFELLPHGAYLEGIIRAYATEVGIDDKPLIERLRAERPEVLTSESSKYRFVDLATVSTPSEWNLENPLESYDREPLHDPIAPPPEHQTAQPSQRRARFALPLVSLIAVAGWGAYLYETTRSTDYQSPRRAGAPEVMPSTPLAQPQQTITSGETKPSTVQSNPDPAPSPETSMTPVVPPAMPSSSQPEPSDAVGPVSNVAGEWTLNTHVERSGYAAFDGLRLGYELRLEQDGRRISGAGRKITENGKEIGSGAQTPITVDGTIDGDRLTLAFAERGTERSTEGRFVLLLDESGALRGRFSSTAAQSSGTVEARRVQ